MDNIKMKRGIIVQIKDCDGPPFESVDGITWPDVNDFFEEMFNSALEDKDNKKIKYTERVVGEDGLIRFYEDDLLVFTCTEETEEWLRKEAGI